MKKQFVYIVADKKNFMQKKLRHKCCDTFSITSWRVKIIQYEVNIKLFALKLNTKVPLKHSKTNLFLNIEKNNLFLSLKIFFLSFKKYNKILYNQRF